MKISVTDIKKTDLVDRGVIKVQQLLNDSDTGNVSVAVIHLDGINKNNRNNVSDMCYFVLKGEGKFIIDRKEYKVNEGSLVTIPKNTVYHDEGKMTLLSISSPRFDVKNVEYLD